MAHGIQRKILIVEDDLYTREALREFSVLQDCQAVVCQDAKEGLMLADYICADLVLVDHRMPDMTGSEFVTKLRQQGYTAKIVLISAQNDVASLASACGASHSLKKPFCLEELEALFKREAE